MRILPFAAVFIALAACGDREVALPDGRAGAAALCEAAEAGALSARGVWVRAQTDQSAMSAGYFTLCNRTKAPVVLTGVSTPAAGISDMHETTRSENGVVSMAHIDDVTLQPGDSVVFEPGGKHVMLMSLLRPIEENEVVPLTLQFADGAILNIEARAISNAEAADHGNH